MNGAGEHLPDRNNVCCFRNDISSFFDTPAETVLLFLESTADLVACLPRNRPRNAKQAALYFVKPATSKVVLPSDVSELAFGKLNLQSIETFNILLEEIYQPVLSESKVTNLPSNVSHDLQRNLQGAILASQSFADNKKVTGSDNIHDRKVHLPVLSGYAGPSPS